MIGRMLLIVLLALNLHFAPAAMATSSFPDQPGTIIVGYPPGGPSDTLARLVADELRQLWKQPVIVENKAGAAGNIGMAAAARAEPDGYTMALVSTTALAINPVLYKDLPFNVDKDFTVVGLLAKIPNVLLVSTEVPADNLQELLALLKKRPGELNGGYPGVGNSAHISLVALEKAAGAKVLHVPYKGNAAGIQGLIANEIQVYFTVASAAPSLVKAGRVKAIAITGEERSDALPNVPTMAEAGLPGFFDTTAWFGLATVAGTPPDIVNKLNADINTVLGRKKFRDYLTHVGALPGGGTTRELFEFVSNERKRWGVAVMETGAKAE